MAALGAIVANPYHVGGMLRDLKQFYGRTRELREILSGLATTLRCGPRNAWLPVASWKSVRKTIA